MMDPSLTVQHCTMLETPGLVKVICALAFRYICTKGDNRPLPWRPSGQIHLSEPVLCATVGCLAATSVAMNPIMATFSQRASLGSSRLTSLACTCSDKKTLAAHKPAPAFTGKGHQSVSAHHCGGNSLWSDGADGHTSAK